MTADAPSSLWRDIAVLVGRLIFAGVFLLAVTFKYLGMEATAGYIASAGFPFPLLLAWLAAIFETALIVCFLTGAFFTEAALLAAAYVLFLGFAFHGPDRWEGNQTEFGFFVNHFTFVAGLLFAAVQGPGKWALRHGLIGRR
jgi:putative oxidoreductase